LTEGTFRLGGGKASSIEPGETQVGRQASRLSDSVAGGAPAPLPFGGRARAPHSQLPAPGPAGLRAGQVAVVTLAAGAGSRWTQGAGVVKALHPFCKFSGRHRTFIEVHLAKSRKTSREAGVPLPHIFTTSYLTDAPIREFLAREK